MYVQQFLKRYNFIQFMLSLSGLPIISELWFCHLYWVGHRLHDLVHLGLNSVVSVPLDPLGPLKFFVLILAQLLLLPPQVSSVSSSREAFISLDPYCLFFSNLTAFLPVTILTIFSERILVNLNSWNISWLLALSPDFHVLVPSGTI